MLTYDNLATHWSSALARYNIKRTVFYCTKIVIVKKVSTVMLKIILMQNIQRRSLQHDFPKQLHSFYLT